MAISQKTLNQIKHAGCLFCFYCTQTQCIRNITNAGHIPSVWLFCLFSIIAAAYWHNTNRILAHTMLALIRDSWQSIDTTTFIHMNRKNEVMFSRRIEKKLFPGTRYHNPQYIIFTTTKGLHCLSLFSFSVCAQASAIILRNMSAWIVVQRCNVISNTIADNHIANYIEIIFGCSLVVVHELAVHCRWHLHVSCSCHHSAMQQEKQWARVKLILMDWIKRLHYITP